MAKTDPKTLLAHGLHLGHKKNKVNPKAQEYIHSFQGGTSIIDLFQTAEALDKAKAYATELGKEGKKLLVVATKKIAREPVTKACVDNDVHYITNKWVAGFVTNFAEISKNIKKMNDMRQKQKDGAWNDLPHHEKVGLEKQLNKIASVYGGVATMEKEPDAVFIIDIRKEANALNESNIVGIPSIAVVDTNVNPLDVTYPIPANDDAISSITYVAEEIVNAYAEGKKKATAKK